MKFLENHITIVTSRICQTLTTHVMNLGMSERLYAEDHSALQPPLQLFCEKCQALQGNDTMLQVRHGLLESPPDNQESRQDTGMAPTLVNHQCMPFQHT